MHRRAASTASAADFGRAAISGLTRLHRVVVIVGVFLFTLALTSLAVSGSARTVNLEFSHSDVVAH
jgi:hypothetical protein